MAKGKGREKNTVFRKKRRGLRLLYLLMSAILIVAALITSCAFFFRVEQIRIEGTTRYSEEQILSAAAIKENANLFLLPRAAISKRIKDNWPYVKTVKLRNSFPNTLVLEIQDCIPQAAVQVGGLYWLLDEEGKVLEQPQESLATTYAKVEGLTLIEPQIGAKAQVPDDQSAKFKSLCSLLKALLEHDMSQDVSWIDLNDDMDIEISYLGRFTVRLPFGTNNSNLQYSEGEYSLKIEALKEIVSRLDETDRGLIDLWGDKGFFRPN